MLLRVGSIYSMFYNNWNTNIKIYAFILYPGFNYIHALNLSAIQLTTIDKVKLVNIIKKLDKVPGSEKYSGLLLWRILKRYAPDQIRKCYRTYIRKYIGRIALVGYGLNDPESFKDYELAFQDKQLFKQAQSDLLFKSMKLFLGKNRMVRTTTVQDTFAKPTDIKAPSPTAPEGGEAEEGGEGELEGY